MIKQISLAALILCIGACASSGPEVPAPETVDTVASGTEPELSPGSEAQEPQAPDASATAVASTKGDPNELVCRREKEAGSNFYKKTCYTRAQLDARSEEDQEALRQMRHMRSGSQNETNPGG
jgi:hypothetical protein